MLAKEWRMCVYCIILMTWVSSKPRPIPMPLMRSNRNTLPSSTSTLTHPKTPIPHSCSPRKSSTTPVPHGPRSS
jgi:hypothetical protein